LSCPKLVIGHPEAFGKTGFPIKDLENDRQTIRLYTQTLTREHKSWRNEFARGLKQARK
jgi:hypothetical protein